MRVFSEKIFKAFLHNAKRDAADGFLRRLRLCVFAVLFLFCVI